MDPQAWFQSLPLITQSWFGASLIVNVATTLDVLSPDDLLFDWHRIYDNLELWRIATSFLYGGGPMNEFHVLLLLYLIPIHSAGYEKNPHPAGGTPRADYAFCVLFCVTFIVSTFLLVEHYEDSILSLFSFSNNHNRNSNLKRFRKQSHLLYPLFTRTLVTAILYLWSRRNPNVNVQLNFIPIRGQYLPFAHLFLALALGNRVNEMLHGMLVGHFYYYLVEIVPTVLGRRVLTTPRILVDLLSSGPQDEERDHRVVVPPNDQNSARNNNNNNIMRAFREDGATRAHIAAKTGDLEQLRTLSASPEGRASLAAKDRNDWQPLHEAARGGYVDVVRFLLEFDDIVDMNARTQGGVGPNALWLAESSHGSEHPVSRCLQEIGAVGSGPQEVVHEGDH
jgi:Derlin-2/3